MIYRFPAIILSALAFSTTSSFAEAWKVDHGEDAGGIPYAYTELAGEVTFSLSCQEDQPDLMRFLMTVDDLPGLPAMDDQSAALTLNATKEGTAHSISFSPWYFGPDRTWTGSLKMTADDVQALFNAERISLENAQQEAILTYTPSPSEAAAQAILTSCTFSQPD